MKGGGEEHSRPKGLWHSTLLLYFPPYIHSVHPSFFFFEQEKHRLAPSTGWHGIGRSWAAPDHRGCWHNLGTWDCPWQLSSNFGHSEQHVVTTYIFSRRSKPYCVDLTSCMGFKFTGRLSMPWESHVSDLGDLGTDLLWCICVMAKDALWTGLALPEKEATGLSGFTASLKKKRKTI